MMKLLLLLVAFVGLWMTSVAEEDISPILDDHLTQIETFISQTRELPILAPIVRKFPTPEEVQTFIRNSYEEASANEDVITAGLFYRALGFVPADLDLFAVYADFIIDQVAGYYDPTTKEMNTILFSGEPLGDELPLLEQVIYAHEFAHALQDQHFDLIAVQEASQNGDQAMAITALIEGDATYMMQAFMLDLMQKDPLAIRTLLNADATLSGTDVMEDVPAIFLAEVQFAYLDGMRFITQLLANGGWARVNRAFENLPQTSAQILYPEKYLAGHIPQTITLPDALPLLGDDWQMVDERTVGAFYLREYLTRHVSTYWVYNLLRAWDGDAMTLYYHADSDSIGWLWGIAWESEGDNALFARLYASFLADEYTTWDVTTACAMTVEDVQEAVCFVTTFDTTYIAFAPDVQVALAMLDAVAVMTE